MSKAPKTSLRTKHWVGYMFGDWGGCMTFALFILGSWAAFKFVWNITPDVRAKMNAIKASK